jgi:hypothetical protein
VGLDPKITCRFRGIDFEVPLTIYGQLVSLKAEYDPEELYYLRDQPGLLPDNIRRPMSTIATVEKGLTVTATYKAFRPDVTDTMDVVIKNFNTGAAKAGYDNGTATPSSDFRYELQKTYDTNVLPLMINPPGKTKLEDGKDAQATIEVTFGQLKYGLDPDSSGKIPKTLEKADVSATATVPCIWGNF